MSDDYVETSDQEEEEIRWKLRRVSEEKVEVEAYPFRWGVQQSAELDSGANGGAFSDILSPVASPGLALTGSLDDEEDAVMHEGQGESPSDDFMDVSQDPLLIQATTPPPDTDYTDPNTPTTSIFSYQPPRSSHSPENSQDPLNLSCGENESDIELRRINRETPASPSRSADNDIHLHSSGPSPLRRVRDEIEEFPSTLLRAAPQQEDDDLMQFSPVQRPLTLASSPLSEPRTSLPKDSSLSPPRRRASTTSDGQLILHEQSVPIAAEGRYPLRKRNRRQENPYLADLQEYHYLLRHNPDAIVKLPRGGHSHRRGSIDACEESQEQEYQPDDNLDDNEHDMPMQQAPIPPRTRSEGFSEISDTDDEEKELRKEWFQLKRKNKEKEKEKEGQRRPNKKSRPHAFPIPRPEFEEGSSRHPTNSRGRERSFSSKSPSTTSSRNRRHLLSRSRSRQVVPDSDGEDRASHSTRVGSRFFTPQMDNHTFPFLKSILGDSYEDEARAGPSRERVDTRFSSPAQLEDYRGPSPSPFSIPDGVRELPGPSGVFHAQVNDPPVHDVDVEMLSDNELLQNAYGVSIEIDDDEEEEEDSGRAQNREDDGEEDQPSSHGSPDDSDIAELLQPQTRKDRKRQKILQSMYPAFVVESMMKEAELERKRREQRKRTASPPPSAENVPVRPGQARKKKAAVPRSNNEIRGDSESSDDEASHPGPASRSSPPPYVFPPTRTALPSLFNSPSPLPRPQNAPTRKDKGKGKETYRPDPEVIEISESDEADEEDDESSSAEEIDEEDIERALNNKPMINNARAQELAIGNGIDYMLTCATRLVGSRAKRKHTSSSHSGVATKSSGNRVSTNSVKEKPTGSHSHKGISAGASSRQREANAMPSERDVDEMTVAVNEVQAAKGKDKKRRKRREKERRKRAQTNGVYTFADGNVFMSARIEPEDFFDKDFETAIAPSSHPYHHHRQNRAVSLRPPPPPHEQAAAVSRPEPIKDNKEEPQTQSHLLKPGIHFGKATYTGSGMLYKLLDPKERLNVSVQRHSGFGFDIDPLIACETLKEMLPRVCDGVLAFMSDLPDVDCDQSQKEWNDMLGNVCLLFSKHMSQEDEDGQQKLKIIAYEQVRKVITRLESDDYSKSFVDLASLNVCWFAVELVIRAGYIEPTVTSGSDSDAELLFRAMSLVTQLVFARGLTRIVEHIRYCQQPMDDTSSGEESSVLTRSAELLVCLIHVSLSPTTPCNTGRVFWKIVEDVLQSQTSGLKPLEVSETTWSTIFSVCALSQFSSIGMRTGTVRLSAAWSVVHFGLRRICLKADEKDDQKLAESTLRKRDRYIALLIRRCFLLTCRWHWRLEDAMEIITTLSDVFRSRKFANLRHERAEFPTFLRIQDWEICSQYNQRDAAFELFLKMVVQMSKQMPDGPQRGARIKKLCSLIQPVSVMLTSMKAPGYQALSMLYNRVAILSVAIHLEPQNYAGRIKHAKEQVDFKASHKNLRTAYIRSLMYFSEQMVLARLPMEDVFGWLGGLADTLNEELSAKLPESRKRVVAMSSQMLIGMARHIIPAYGVVGQYPDPTIFEKLAGLIKNSALSEYPATTSLVVGLMDSYMNVRAKVVPAPQFPHVQPAAVESEESQETQYDFDDMDYNDPALLAALDGDNHQQDPAETSALSFSDYHSKDAALPRPLYQINVTLYGHFCSALNVFKKPAVSSTDLERVDGCMEAWLLCASMLIQVKHTKKWDFYLGLSPWNVIEDVRWRRRTRIHVMYTVLKLDPVSYTGCSQVFVEALFWALVPDEPTIEHKFISLLLSLDGLKHALLQGLAVERSESNADYAITAIDLQAKRVSFIRCLFRNVNRALLNEDPEGKDYVEWCIALLETTHTMYLAQVSEKREGYRDLCIQICDLLSEQPRLRGQSRMEFWVSRSAALRAEVALRR
ncbi:hypothetical protein Moror_17446 [Moniliophthora roreri MCA 2997]|uniref:Protein mms22 n=2 Tax=Moniliophthora roreri TaxID=221103 RepID=V2XES8_MONRO|nr:hypothetical protein Moror_17446 [Moniliophthora roreri MCA 2997]